jgi:hypothetical protein
MSTRREWFWPTALSQNADQGSSVASHDQLRSVHDREEESAELVVAERARGASGIVQEGRKGPLAGAAGHPAEPTASRADEQDSSTRSREAH